MTRYRVFDRSRLQLAPITQRGQDILASEVIAPAAPASAYKHTDWDRLMRSIREARTNQRPRILFFGAHLIKLGLSRFIIDLMEQGFISHLATNGAGAIHDFELATVGGTSENVQRWIRCGRFGLWTETSGLNDFIRVSAAQEEGLGEGLGRQLLEWKAPHTNVSIAAAAYRLNIPLTVHVTVGGDIIHQHPNCCGRSLGSCSYTDFLIFSDAIEQLEGGVFMNVGTAVTGPEVYLKALSMARNVASAHNETISDFTTAVFDLVALPANWRREADKSSPGYYYRPWKTILIRTVADGGTSFYFQGDHSETIPTLWTSLREEQ